MASNKPIYLSKIQMRLAMELAAQEACQLEYKRQIEPQLNLGPMQLEVQGAAIDLGQWEWPEFQVCGRQVIWVD